ncbi:MAG: NAD(+)/NADH kinase [Gemmatimonadota bacterium]|nr:NAD(+)/NADH kinase [Gemmatimonadota bacterium]
MRLTLMHNPKAGERQPSKRELLALLRSAGYDDVVSRSTKNKGWKTAVEAPSDLVVVAGGDGTVAKVARRLAGRGVPMAVLPLGTANNIARSLGVSGSPRQLIARWRTAALKPVDLGVVSGQWGTKYFLEAFGVGLFSRMLARARGTKRRRRVERVGPLELTRRHTKVMLHELQAIRPMRLLVRVDGRESSGDYMMLEVMNARSIGLNLELAPDADMSDGLLDVIAIRAGEEDRLAEHLQRRIGGRPALIPVERARCVEIVGTDVEAHLDDKVLEPASGEGDEERSPEAGGRRIEVSVQAGAVQVLV